jgi:acetolactate synthase I/II/III large subunit
LNVAELLISRLSARGVKRIYGLPGGGSSLDLLAAASDVGIEFVLVRSENAAVMMAAAEAELTGVPGVVITTKGPGVANAVNGLAYASLDRSAVVFLCDGFDAEERGFVTHQVFDQAGLLAPLTKAYSTLGADDVAAEIDALLALALAPPAGPVCIELTSQGARRKVATTSAASVTEVPAAPPAMAPTLAAACSLLQQARRPVVLIGLEAREAAAAAATRELVDLLDCPVLTTYKAKGVVADARCTGLFTCGAAEQECVGRADLIICVGLDPVELIRKRWTYTAPVLDIATLRHEPHYVRPTVGMYGPIAAHLGALAQSAVGSQWSAEEIMALRQGIEKRLQYMGQGPIGPQAVVEIMAQEAGRAGVHPRVTIDAGAHMFSAMAFWPCEQPNDVLISNGLATMAFALPAAIASARHEPDRPVVAFTGDGGLLMCLGELSTAAAQSATLVVVVFNDAALSLIAIKQQEGKVPENAVAWTHPDFAAVMRGLGGAGYRVTSCEEYRSAVVDALARGGPAVIDVVVDATGYPAQLAALRG